MYACLKGKKASESQAKPTVSIAMVFPKEIPLFTLRKSCRPYPTIDHIPMTLESSLLG